METRKKIWLVLAIITLATLACNFTVNGTDIATLLAPTNPPASTLTPAPTQAITPVVVGDLAGMNETLVALYERTSPGVVAIQTLQDTGSGLGSGIVYDTEGHIITNYHVVEGATDLEVDFPSGLKVRGEVIAIDSDSDLAVIKVEVEPDELHPLPFGDSDLLQVGQLVVAIGNPFGLYNTMTLGIISAKGRTLSSLRETEVGSGSYYSAGDIIQTDASINPGNSGGPLLNLNGEVIGMNRAIRTTGTTSTGDPVNSGIGFAISSNIITRVVPSLIAQGYYDYPYLGIRPLDDPTLMEREILGIERTSGAYILEVVAGSPADRAGLRGGTRQTDIQGLLAGGDLITGVDGRPVRIFDELISYMLTHKSPGDSMTLTIVRDNEEMEVTVNLTKRP